MPRPVTRMAPKPRRLTVRSPPMAMVVGTSAEPDMIRLLSRPPSIDGMPSARLGQVRLECRLARIRLVEVCQVDDAPTVGRARDHVDEAVVPQDFLRGIGEARMHRLIEGLVGAGQKH